ncbi:hypothetical protein SSTU70S_01120 [Stutzerimonas stutzeri]
MLWCIEEDHSAVIDHFACVSDEEGRQVHVKICAGGMRYQDLAFGLVDRCVQGFGINTILVAYSLVDVQAIWPRCIT